MENKGFTLIELLAVLTLLALISTIVVVNVFSSQKKAKLKLYESQKDNIIIAAKEWGTDNYDRLPLKESTEVKVEIKELYDDGLIEDIPINPKLNKKMSMLTTFTIVKNGKTFNYDLYESDIRYD